jgi:hypothetical protein
MDIRAESPPGAHLMLSLTDSELKVLMRLAEPIAPRLRGQFLETVAAELHGAHGDGAAYRIARDVQRRFLNATAGPLPAMRPAARVGVTSRR